MVWYRTESWFWFPKMFTILPSSSWPHTLSSVSLGPNSSPLYSFRVTSLSPFWMSVVSLKSPSKPVFGPREQNLYPFFFSEVGPQNDTRVLENWDELHKAELEVIPSRLRLRELTCGGRIVFFIIYLVWIYCNPNPQGLQNVTDYGAMLFIHGNQVKIRSLWWASLCCDWCLDKRERTGGRYMQREDDVKKQGKDGFLHIKMSGLQSCAIENRCVSYLVQRTLL